MPDYLEPPDIDAGVIARVKTVLTEAAGWVVTDRFPLDGAEGTDRLVTILASYGEEVDSRFTSTYEVTADVWAAGTPTVSARTEALAAANAIRRALTTRGGFRLDENGVVTLGRATLLPVRIPSGNPNDRYARFTATYDLSVRATVAAS